MNELILNADYFIEDRNGSYIMTSNDINYILHEDDNILIEQDNLANVIPVSIHEKDYIINKCLEEYPF